MYAVEKTSRDDGSVCPKTKTRKALLRYLLKKLMFAAMILCAGSLFAQIQDTVAEIGAEETENGGGALSGEETAGYNLRRNSYFRESLRQKSLANLALSEGEYDASEFYSAEAVRYARLSDEYIAGQLARQRALRTISDARKHLEWAKTAEAPKYYPEEYRLASEHYTEAIEARDAEDWDGATEYSLLVAQDLAGVAAPPIEDKTSENMPEFPSKYTVRPWDKFGDCFWNIAYWFYGDYYKWPALFKANRDKLPDPDNPDLVEVGTVIDIPAIGNEIRVGMWDSGRLYNR